RDQRRSAPLRVRRRGEHRFVEHVLPVAGELALGEYARLERARPPAVAGDDDVAADLHRRHAAAHERRDAELAERLHQAEAGGLVVGEREAADHRALVGGHPDRARLGDQVADGEDEAVLADDDAVADALGAEQRRGERVVGHDRAQVHHRVERAIELEAPVFRLRPKLLRECPVLFLGHRDRFYDYNRTPLAASKRCACFAFGASEIRSPGEAEERPWVAMVRDWPPTFTTSSVSAPIGSTTTTSASIPLPKSKCTGRMPYLTLWPSFAFPLQGQRAPRASTAPLR